jgi:hypothetical protein
MEIPSETLNKSKLSEHSMKLMTKIGAFMLFSIYSKKYMLQLSYKHILFYQIYSSNERISIIHIFIRRGVVL